MSRDSRIGLPPSIVSTMASSRARSWISRAMRNRYLPRSSAGSAAHFFCAARADFTACAISSGPATAMSASGSSVAGLIVGAARPTSLNSPSTNTPYASRSRTWSADSGAGE